MILPRKPVRGEAVKASLLGQIIDYMRRSTPIAGPGIFMRAGPGGTIIGVKAGDEPGAGGGDDLYPFKVRFVPSAENGAAATDGDFIVYIPEGSLTVAGVVADPVEFGLPEYTAGEYEDLEDWYELPRLDETGAYWLNFELEFGEGDEDDTLYVSIDTEQLNEADGEPHTVARSVALADVTIVPPSEGEGSTPGSVTVAQVTKGPLTYEYNVESLNGLIGSLEVVADDEGIDINGETYYVSVETDPETGTIALGLTKDEPPEPEGLEGYCNKVSADGGDQQDPENDISGDGHGGGGGAMNAPDNNSISRDPCKKEPSTEENA